MSKIMIGAKIEEDEWDEMREITGKETNTEIVHELMQIARSPGAIPKKEGELEAKTGQKT